MRYLVDANVVSEATRQEPDRKVMSWLVSNELACAVNPIILGEIEFGILALPSGKRRKNLQEWFCDAVRALQVLEMDAATGSEWAILLAELKRKGRAMPVKDSLIAATARQHKLTVATRNLADYKYAGVALVNPFA
ncbi:PIN domain-containing protein [Lacipirellula parvula]|uniref:VapC toxin protein n=1 Tax=Lacipirellula parvula TaxID=2650471 RepID=A0A5K7XLA7_9BACT|nr:PIN domain-containing protein [Lacipirellula parvula]BBO35396.1 vapC toxin protein [Lacipirellula parvula]